MFGAQKNLVGRSSHSVPVFAFTEILTNSTATICKHKDWSYTDQWRGIIKRQTHTRFWSWVYNHIGFTIRISHANLEVPFERNMNNKSQHQYLCSLSETDLQSLMQLLTLFQGAYGFPPEPVQYTQTNWWTDELMLFQGAYGFPTEPLPDTLMNWCYFRVHMDSPWAFARHTLMKWCYFKVHMDSLWAFARHTLMKWCHFNGAYGFPPSLCQAHIDEMMLFQGAYGFPLSLC